MSAEEVEKDRRQVYLMTVALGVLSHAPALRRHTLFACLLCASWCLPALRCSSTFRALSGPVGLLLKALETVSLLGFPIQTTDVDFFFFSSLKL